MIDYIVKQTNEYLKNIPKTERKRYGQFFTSPETARFMASLFVIPQNKDVINILDPGAGAGILSCALVERIQNESTISKIILTCYENDSNILEVLKNNLEYIKQEATVDFSYNLIEENYITNQYLEFNDLIGKEDNPQKYDLIIGNPPYMKIAKDAAEAKSMPEICYGAPNLYFLFAAMSLFNLEPEGELVYIIPRSWTSGAYFKKFRQYFLQNGKLFNIHLFVSRNKVFDQEEVLQETIIIRLVKTQRTPATIKITSSKSNKDFVNNTALDAPYDIVVSGDDLYVYLITDRADIDILNRVGRWNNTLPELGIKMKTGLTVDFRNREILRNNEEEGAIPLFYSQHIKDGTVNFPIQKENEYVVTNQRGLLQKNRNYLFVKRFTAKEEHRRLQCGIYLAKKFSNYENISTQNKINFIDGITSELSECLIYGLYVIFNSSIYDEYYRILNGSTQVNSTEINSMPMPTLDIIKDMGQRLLRNKDLSEENCNMILEEYYA